MCTHAHTHNSRLHIHARSHAHSLTFAPEPLTKAAGSRASPTFLRPREGLVGGLAARVRGENPRAGALAPVTRPPLSTQRRLPGGLRTAVPLHVPLLLHPPGLPALPPGPHQQHPVRVRPRAPGLTRATQPQGGPRGARLVTMKGDKVPSDPDEDGGRAGWEKEEHGQGTRGPEGREAAAGGERGQREASALEVVRIGEG